MLFGAQGAVNQSDEAVTGQEDLLFFTDVTGEARTSDNPAHNEVMSYPLPNTARRGTRAMLATAPAN